MNHILRQHGKDGITIEHIYGIRKNLLHPIAILKPSGNTKDSMLFVTDMNASYRFRQQDGSYRSIETPVVIAVKNNDNGSGTMISEVVSMFPWKPDMQNGMTIQRYAQEPGNLLAVDKKRDGSAAYSSNTVGIGASTVYDLSIQKEASSVKKKRWYGRKNRKVRSR
jgi:hypothetical protein